MAPGDLWDFDQQRLINTTYEAIDIAKKWKKRATNWMLCAFFGFGYIFWDIIKEFIK